MPKKLTQNKQPVPQKRTKAAARPGLKSFRPAPQSVGSIMKSQAWLQGLARGRAAQHSWLQWISAALPAEMRDSLVNVMQKGAELVVLTSSAAWSARVRFALAGLEAEIKAKAPGIHKTTVRISPAGSLRG